MILNGRTYDGGTLERFATKEFALDPVDLTDDDAVIRVKASMNGNRFGMTRPIYSRLTLMGRGARYKVNAADVNTFDITLTTKLSGFAVRFRLFPFATKHWPPAVADGQAELHVTENGNHWITSKLATPMGLVVTYPAEEPKRGG